jgi:hypothetical protein
MRLNIYIKIKEIFVIMPYKQILFMQTSSKTTASMVSIVP